MPDLKTNLEEEATAKGLSGEERHRFIGGTIHNIETRKLTPKKQKHAARKETKSSSPESQAQAEKKPRQKSAYQIGREKRNTLVTFKTYTDSEIASFEKELEANKEKIKKLQALHTSSQKDSYQYHRSIEEIRSLNEKNTVLSGKVHSTTQTSLDRYESKYKNHKFISQTVRPKSQWVL